MRSCDGRDSNASNMKIKTLACLSALFVSMTLLPNIRRTDMEKRAWDRGRSNEWSDRKGVSKKALTQRRLSKVNYDDN